ncbi:MAG: hypothetical protein KA031_02790, partial [Candidatus Hydrogenedentes bacterium]|nr:hypothetical protein [Candidatus Hydrogenedentota bacterium]
MDQIKAHPIKKLDFYGVLLYPFNDVHNLLLVCLIVRHAWAMSRMCGIHKGSRNVRHRSNGSEGIKKREEGVVAARGV